VSDLGDAAAAALGIPSELAERSAAARAAADGTSATDLLGSWAGGAPVAPAPAPAPAPAITTTERVETADTAPATAVAVVEQPLYQPTVIDEPAFEEEPTEPLEPVSLGQRLGTAVKVGAWTGAGLGVLAFFVASAFWAPNSAVLPDQGPVVQASSNGVLIGAALISILFGAIVAGFSRASASWRNPAMQLTNSPSATAWLGATTGLVLGAAGGALLLSAGTAIDGSEDLVQLPVLATLGLMLIGGAVLGAATAAVPQLLGTPVAVEAEDSDEVAIVRRRLGNAISIPLAGLLLLLLLVVPFGYLLIETNHLAGGGAAVVAIVVASGILGFASLAGSRPEMRITFGDLMVAIAGIGTIILVLLAVLVMGGDNDHAEDPESEARAPVVHQI
jgi:hypothetical protein